MKAHICCTVPTCKFTGRPLRESGLGAAFAGVLGGSEADDDDNGDGASTEERSQPGDEVEEVASYEQDAPRTSHR